jgi:hypothetical protein
VTAASRGDDPPEPPAAPGPFADGRDRPDTVEFGSDRPPRRPWLIRALIGVVIVAAGAVAVSHSADHHATRHHRPAPPPGPPVTVINVRRHLLGVHGGWELFARGPDDMIAIQLAAGRVTTTRVPELASSSPEVAFVLGAHYAIIRSFDEVPGYLIPDGASPRPLTGALAAHQPGPLLPGPRPGQAWVTTGNVGNSALQLLGPDGKPTGTSARLPPGGDLPATAIPDGRGDALVLNSNNIAYDVGPTSFWQVHATVIAVGPSRWLGFICHREARCSNVAINAATGAQRALAASSQPLVPAFAWPSLGVTAPNGSVAAVLVYNTPRVYLYLLNLSTGAERLVSVTIPPTPGYQAMAWSPDSRWLFVAAAYGRLMAVDARTGTATGLGIRLPAVTQVAVRAAPGSGPGS